MLHNAVKLKQNCDSIPLLSESFSATKRHNRWKYNVGEHNIYLRNLTIFILLLTIIGPDNGLLSSRRQAIIWTNAGILLIGNLGTHCSEILSEIQTFSFKKVYLKMSSGKWRPFCLGLNVLTNLLFHCSYTQMYHNPWEFTAYNYTSILYDNELITAI